MVVRSPRAASAWSISRAEELHGDVLERQRRPVEQLEQEGLAPNCASGTTAGCRKVP